MAKSAADLVAEARSQLEVISPEQAATEAGSGAVILDVREAEECQHGHIDGSILIPRGVLESFADPSGPHHPDALAPDARIIVVCRSGARAALAAQTLQVMGYTDVALLDGGLAAWQAAGLPVVEHAYTGI
jgi:rhodanese-related sulfurtransferase